MLGSLLSRPRSSASISTHRRASNRRMEQTPLPPVFPDVDGMAWHAYINARMRTRTCPNVRTRNTCTRHLHKTNASMHAHNQPGAASEGIGGKTRDSADGHASARRTSLFARGALAGFAADSRRASVVINSPPALVTMQARAAIIHANKNQKCAMRTCASFMPRDCADQCLWCSANKAPALTAILLHVHTTQVVAIDAATIRLPEAAFPGMHDGARDAVFATDMPQRVPVSRWDADGAGMIRRTGGALTPQFCGVMTGKAGTPSAVRTNT